MTMPSSAVTGAPSFSDEEKPRNDDLRQILQAGQWALLRPRERAAMRTTCKDAMGVANMLQDLAVLRTDAFQSDTAGAGPACPYPLAIGAFHARLGQLRQLHVYYDVARSNGEVAESEQRLKAYCASFTHSHLIEKCVIKEVGTTRLQAASLSILLEALPQLHTLTILRHPSAVSRQVATAAAPPAATAAAVPLPAYVGLVARNRDTSGTGSFDELLEVLAGHPNLSLQHLNLVAHGRQQSMQAYELDLLCSLTQLHTLRGSWHIRAAQLQRLTHSLPHVQCLGARHINTDSISSSLPCVHTLSSPLPPAEAHQLDSDMPIGFDFRSQDLMATHHLELTCLPALRHLHNALLYGLVSSTLTAHELRSFKDVTARFAESASSWAWQVDLRPGEDFPPSMRALLPAGSLLGLRNLWLRRSSPVSNDWSSWMLPVIKWLLEAAPCTESICMSMNHGSVEALKLAFKTLRIAANLQFLWLDVSELGIDGEIEDRALVLLELAGLLTRPEMDIQETAAIGCHRLQHILVRPAGWCEASAAANALLHARGSAVRFEAWDSFTMCLPGRPQPQGQSHA